MIKKIEEILGVDGEEYIENWLQSEEFRNRLAIAITHFAFRNGPIEDIHANPEKNITDEDMEILNKYMVNSIASVLNLFGRCYFPKIMGLALTSENFGADWDKPDTKESDERLEAFVKNGAFFGLSSFANKNNLL